MIQYMIIHCHEHIERLQHITSVQNQLQQPLELFRGVYSRNIKMGLEDQRQFIHEHCSEIQSLVGWVFCKPGQVGCFLSHYKAIEKIANDKRNGLLMSEYTVIFEDDVNFVSNDVHSEIVKIINSLDTLQYDFDIMYLGNTCDNHGEQIVDNVYKLDFSNYCFGTHALLIKNANVEKIYNANNKILQEIDTHYWILGQTGQLNLLVVYPILCTQNWSLPSNINIY
jgi:GR25 family glycosyltransferase involved in LPS biosynthesis